MVSRALFEDPVKAAALQALTHGDGDGHPTNHSVKAGPMRECGVSILGSSNNTLLPPEYGVTKVTPRACCHWIRNCSFTHSYYPTGETKRGEHGKLYRGHVLVRSDGTCYEDYLKELRPNPGFDVNCLQLAYQV